VNLPVRLIARQKRDRYIYSPGERVRRFAPLGIAVGAIVWGLICGLLAAILSPYIAIVALALSFVAFHKPELVIIVLLVMTSTIVAPTMVPTINLGFKFTAAELCLVLLLGLLVGRFLLNPYKSSIIRTPLDLPILVFFAAATLSFFNSMNILGQDRGYLVPQWRIIFDYLIFFAVTNFVRTRQQFRLLTSALLILAALTAAMSIAQGLAGPYLSFLPTANLGVANVFDQEYAGVPRVIVPGTTLIYLMFLPVLFLYVTRVERDRTRQLLAIVFALLIGSIALTFDRTWWLGIAAGITGLLILLTSAQRGRLFRRIALPVIGLLLLIQVISPFVPQAGNFVQVLGLRAISLFGGEQTIQDPSTQWRLREIDSAVVKIQNNPLLGVGPGGELRDKWWSTDILTRFMHNSYLFILADVGFLGFLPFLWFSGVFVYRGFRHGRRLKDPHLRAWVLGLSLSFVALAVAAFAGPEFMQWDSVPVIGVIFGISEVAIRLGQSPPEPASSHHTAG
jgi:O-antigen ligase